MRMRTEVALRAEQRLTLAPRMLQSIEVLQLAHAELTRKLYDELESNETLELVAVEQGAETLPPRQSEQVADEREPSWEDFEARRRPAGNEASDRKQELMAEVPGRGQDLLQHVEEQLALEQFTADLRDKVLELTGLLDEHGYLELERSELAERLGEQGLDDALSVLQRIEPVGLGTRGPVEAMLAQVAPTDPDRPQIERILHDHLEDLARQRHAAVARALDIDDDELAMLLERIAGLLPRPADRLRDEAAAPVHPDVQVLRGPDGRWEVVVDDQSLPVLGVVADYAAMADDRGADRAVRSYLRGKLRAARDLIHAVQHRKETLARVAAEIFAQQAAFLQRGPTAIRPLRMSDLAARLGLHTSTVSRAIAGKWVGTELGVFPLKSFFDGARGAAARGGTGSAGEVQAGVGRGGVQARIRELIDSESAEQPWSDDDLVRELGRRGVAVARRTVAKYRRELGIPSSWERRRAAARPVRGAVPDPAVRTSPGTGSRTP